MDISCLAPFSYVALGHIHRPQSMGRESIRYCGSMLKYSVSEWEQEKSVTEVILEAPGTGTGDSSCIRCIRYGRYA